MEDHEITVRYGNFDGDYCFCATVADFPEIEEYADTAVEARELALDSIEIIVEHQGRRVD